MKRGRRRRHCSQRCTTPQLRRPERGASGHAPSVPRMTGPRTGQSLGRPFGWLWAAYGVSTFGTWLAFDAFSLIAIIVLHAGPAQVSLLAATGLAVGGAVAGPLGPWGGVRRQRPVVIGMGLTRLAALISIPAAFALGSLPFAP